MAMATTKNVQNQYKLSTALATKTITTVEVFQLGVLVVVEVICSDGTTRWITVNQGVITETGTKPYV